MEDDGDISAEDVRLALGEEGEEGEKDSCGDQDISPSHFHTWKSSP